MNPKLLRRMNLELNVNELRDNFIDAQIIKAEVLCENGVINKVQLNSLRLIFLAFNGTIPAKATSFLGLSKDTINENDFIVRNDYSMSEVDPSNEVVKKLYPKRFKND